jgi:hypothetical protein
MKMQELSQADRGLLQVLFASITMAEHFWIGKVEKYALRL